MPRLRQIALLALACAALVAACDTPGAGSQAGPTAPPSTADAENVAKTFLDAWNKNDYATMYGLISPRGQLISPEAFKEAYTKVDQILKPSENGKSYELLADKTERQGTTVVVHYNMKFNSGPLGEFTDPDRTMRLVLKEKGWRVAWSTMDIFEGMAGGATLNLELTQSERGVIYDRNGKVIAQNGTPNLSVRLLTREFPTGRPSDCFYKLAEVFRLREADLEQYAAFKGLDYGFTIGHLSKDDYDARHADLDKVCKLGYYPQTTRFYYGGGLAPQTIGFVGSIPSEELGNYPGYSQDALIGRVGIEQYWEKQLAGESGARLVITAPGNIEVREIQHKDPSPSQDVTLTIDRDLQLATEQAIADAYNVANWARFSTGTAAIVLDINTGEVLAMANFPSVDPDAYLRTSSFDYPDTLVAYDKRRALFNRATQETYALGSVFKIVSMAAAADTGTFKLNQIYTCTGTFDDPEVPGGKRKDWIYLDKYVEQNYHGPITLIQALTGSCDTYFWEVGKQLYEAGGSNPDQLRKYANQMGLGVKTGIDAALNEAQGNIPDPNWKFKTTGTRWGVGDNLNTVIGQGEVQVTPIQVARMIMGVGNGGSLYKPVLVRSVGTPGQPPSYVPPTAPPTPMGLDPKVLAGIQKGLCDVTRQNIMPGTKNQNLGTAHFVFYNWDFGRIAVCGKTGTAQTGAAQPNGWFAAYAGRVDPKTNTMIPEIAVVAIVERSREGSETAGPIVRRIIESYYKLPLEPYPDFWTGEYEAMPDPGASDGGGPHTRR